LGSVLLLAIGPFFQLYSTLSQSLPFFELILLIALLAGVVRNPRFSYFLRFNTMQSILIGIAVSIVGILLSLLNTVSLGSSALLLEALQTLTFFATLTAVVYSIVRSATGLFPELPWISEAAYSYLRY
jgi:uncharacterized membrane protein